MKNIDIDLDIHKFIENERLTFTESENDILRRILGIRNENIDQFPEENTSQNRSNQPSIYWEYKGVRLPEGTKLRKKSRYREYNAIIHNGQIFVNNKYYTAPSSAAMSVNGGTSVNGWEFWEYYDDINKRWYKLNQLRK